MTNQDITEYEAKFYPVDKNSYRSTLKELGAKLTVPERKLFRTIADSRGNLNIKKNGYIRVRKEGELIRLSYKVTADQTGNLSDQKEIDVEVSDYKKTIDIFEAIGIKFDYNQETLREEWEYKGAQITIDTWPGLDPYSEIETDSEQKVKEIAKELGFDWDKRIITAAPEIYERVYKIDINDVLKMLQNITFENNPFEGLEKHELEYN